MMISDVKYYRYMDDVLILAPTRWKLKTTIERLMERISRIYEQGADSLRIGQYVSRWMDWVVGGMSAK